MKFLFQNNRIGFHITWLTMDPNYVGSKPRNRMTTNSLIFTHKVKLAICVATESLALKAHSFN